MKFFNQIYTKKGILIFLLLIAFSFSKNLYSQQSNCLNFDGTNDVVVIDDISVGNLGTGNFTIEAWIKSDNSGVSVQQIVSNRYYGVDSKFFAIRAETYVAVEIYGGTGGSNYMAGNGSKPVNDGKWHHIAVVRTGLSSSIYVDGVFDFTVSSTNLLDVSSGFYTCIGGRTTSTGYTNFFDGSIDEVRIWTKARTQSEIQQYMHNPLNPANEPNLVAYYNFNQGIAGSSNPSETVLNDLTAHNYDGTLTNFDLSNTTNWVDGHKNGMFLVFNTLTSNETITLPLNGTVNVFVNWGDGSSENVSTTGEKSHIYANAGTYYVTIYGNLSQYGPLNTNPTKIVKVLSFGDLGLTSLNETFKGATNLTQVPAVLPSTVTDLSFTFWNATNFSQDLNTWDVTNVTDMKYLFSGTHFNGNISNWNTSNVTNMLYLFCDNTSFNQDISGWDVSNVTDMFRMFQNAQSFNQDISSWNISSLTSLNSLFAGAISFNQDLSDWNISNITDMQYLFSSTALSAANYSNMLIAWSGETLITNVTLHSSSEYHLFAINARNILISLGWTIIDGGEVGLVAYYPFNGNVNDVSGNGNNGTMLGTLTPITDRYNNSNSAYSFDNYEYINCGSVNTLNTSNFSISFLVKASVGGSILTTRHDNGYYSNSISLSGNKINFFTDGSGHMGTNAQSTTSINDNEWFHVVCIKEGTTMKTYVNGILESSVFDEYGVLFGDYMAIGYHGAWGSYYEGSLDEIRIYNKILTDEEIYQLKETPTLNTTQVTNLTEVSAQLNGNIVNEGTSSLIDKGFVWSANPNPTTTVNSGSISNGTGTGEFSYNLTGLTTGLIYYVRAYATNSQGTSYGQNISFRPQMQPHGNALNFDGINDYVNLGSEANFGIDWNTPFSIETWIKTTEPADHAIIASLDVITYKGWIFDLTVDGNLRLILSNSISSNVLGCYSTGTIDDGNWHHCVVTYDGSGNANNVKFYIDGYASSTIVDANTLSASIATSGNVYLGNRVNATNYCIDATIDEIRIWNVVLTQTEICENMSKPIANPVSETNLLAYYDFDQTSGTVLIDLKNGYNGTLVNMEEVTSDALQVPTIITSANGLFSTNNLIPVEVNFYTEVDGFEQSDITVTNGSINGFTDLGSGKYGFDVTTTTLGTIQISVPANACTSDNIGQPNLAGTLNVEYFSPQGNALNFDGVNDFVEIENEQNFDFTTSMTVECWIKTPGFTKQFEAIITKGDASWRIHSNNFSQSVFFSLNFVGGSNREISTTTNFNDNKWHHIAAVYDGTKMYIYVDGVLENSINETLSIDNISDKVKIGKNVDFYNRYFGGTIDEVRIWNVARNITDIQANMLNQLQGNEAGLVAYYRFDQGDAGQTNNLLANEVIDYSGNCNKGTLTNFALTGETSNWVTNGNPEAPIISTEGGVVSSTSANLVGTIFSTGETNITERGFCYSTSQCATIANDKVFENGNFSTLENYPLEVTNLTPATKYYYRAYAINSKGTSYGEEKFFTTLGLIGNYTIDVSTSTTYPSGTNFQSFGEAVAYMDLNGISGPVVFTVKDGTYNEQVRIPEITVVSEINTITFIAENQKVPVLQYDPISQNYIVQFDGCDYVTFDGIKVVNVNLADSPSGKVFDIKNGSTFCTIQNCEITGINTPTGNSDALISNQTGEVCNNLTIQNNILNFGKQGIWASILNQTNLIIQNNIVKNCSNTGIVIYSLTNPLISGNTFKNSGNWTIHFYQVNNGFLIEKNIIETNSSGIYINECGAAGISSIIANNFMNIGGLIAQSLENSNYINFYHNTVRSAGDFTLKTLNISNCNIKNNILFNYINGYALYAEATDNFSSDFNCLYNSGTYLCHKGTSDYGTLEAWQTGSGNTQDMNSISVVPEFYSSTDLHLVTNLNADLDQTGANFGITEDIDGQIRNNPPDIGADEFEPMTPPGNALNFDGADDIISIGDVNELDNATHFTVETWINIPLSGHYRHIFRKGSDAAERIGMEIYNPDGVGNNDIAVFMGNGANGYLHTTNSPLVLGTWNHIALVYNGTLSSSSERAKLYINGELQIMNVQNDYIPTVTCTNDFPVIIGEWVLGSIDEVRIWNTALEQSFIQQNMAVELTGTESGLIAYYNFNQGIAGGNNQIVTTLYDIKQNYHGTLNNFALTGETSNWVESGAMKFSDAGEDQYLCQDFTNLNAINSDPYIGVWNVISGFGLFENINSNSTFVSNLDTGINEFIWSVNIGGVYYKDTVSIFNNSVTAFAGNDSVFSASTNPLTFNLNASQLQVEETGYWTSNNPNNIFANSLLNSTLVTLSHSGIHHFSWNVSNAYCQTSDEIEITARTIITNKPKPNADTLWNSPFCWTPEIIPTEYDRVIITNGTVLVEGTEENFYSLNVKSGGTLIIKGSDDKAVLGKAKGFDLSIEQDIEKGSIASVKVYGGGELSIEQDIEKSSRAYNQGIKIGSGGELSIEQDIEKSNEVKAFVNLGLGKKLEIVGTNPDLARPKVFVGNGGELSIEQDIEKVKSAPSVLIHNGGELSIEQDIEYAIPAVLIKGGGELSIEQDIEKETKQIYQNSKLTIKGGELSIEQDIEKGISGQISVHNGGELSIEQDIEKINNPSKVRVPKLFINSGRVIIGDTLGLSYGPTTLFTGELSIEQDIEKSVTSPNLIVGSGGEINLTYIEGVTDSTFIQVGENASITLLYDATITSDSVEIPTIEILEGGSVVNQTINGNVDGELNVQQVINQGKTYLTNPITDVNSDFFADYSLFKWTENQNNWTTVPENTQITVLQGYKVESEIIDTIMYYGFMNSGLLSVNLQNTLSNSINERGWNIIGNPYTSAIDFEQIALQDIENTMYKFNTSTQNFEIYQQNGIMLNSANQIIDIGEGFFVKTSPQAQNVTFQLGQSGKVHNIPGLLKLKTSENKTTPENILFTVSNTTNSDQTFVGLETGATTTFESNKDIFKLLAAVPQIYTVGGNSENLAANIFDIAPEDYKVIPMNFESSVNGNYSIAIENSIERENLKINLHDILTDEITDLNTVANYDFTFTNGQNKERFELIFDYRTVNIEDEVNNEEVVVIYSYGNEVFVKTLENKNYNVEIFNVLGQKAFEAEIHGSGINSYTVNSASGIYLVKVTNGIKFTSKQVFIN